MDNIFYVEAKDVSGTLYHGTFTNLASILEWLDDGWITVIIKRGRCWTHD